MSGEKPHLGVGEQIKELFFDLVKWDRITETVREFGHKKAVGIVLAAVLVLVKFVVGPQLASKWVAATAEAYGAEIEVEDWGFQLWGLRATAEGVAMRVRGPYARRELLEADEIELDFDLWRAGRGWVKSVELRSPRLYLERTLSGHWNFMDAIDRVPGDSAPLAPSPGRRIQTAGAGAGASSSSSDFELTRLRIDRGELEWVENLPGASGSGVVHHSQASMLFTHLDIDLKSVRGLLDWRDNATGLRFDGRLADGKVSIQGRVNFFRWSEDETTARLAGGPPADAESAWSPTLDATIYLENVGVAAFAELAPDAAIVPASGTMFGTLQLQVTEDAVACTTNLTLVDVEFAVNRDSPVMVGRADAVSQDLAGYRANDRIRVGCEGNAKRGRPMQVVTAAVTRGATGQASPRVQQIAAYEQARYSAASVTDPTVLALQHEVALRIGDPAAQAIFATDASGQSAFTRGMKKVGRKIKDAFTRDDE